MLGRNLKSTIVRGFLLLGAVLFSFTCLAIYNTPGIRQVWHPHVANVKWKLYGDILDVRDEYVHRNGDIETDGILPLLDNLSFNFQEQLLSGLPLKCNSGGGVLSKKYERFLKTLEDYTIYHQYLTAIPFPRTLVWQCTSHEHCGGLGDRIKGVTYSLLLAMFSRRRLVVYWEESPEGAYLKPHMVDWKDKNKLLKTPHDDSIRHDDHGDSSDHGNNSSPEIYMFKFHDVMKGMNPINDISKSDMSYYQRMIGSNSSNIVLSTNLNPSSLLDAQRNGGDPNWIIDGLGWSGLLHLSPSDLDDVVGLVFRYLFKIKDEVLEEMRAADDILGLFSSPYLGLHIRSGFAGMKHVELIRHPKLIQSDKEWNAALECGLSTADRLLGNSSILFLATDSDLVKQMAVSNFGRRVHSLKNSLIHVDKLQKDISTKEREGIMVMWVEFLLLAQAGVQVRGDSGYSWVAGLLCGIEDRRIINTKNCT